jgi:NADPH:quinone reductase-like Zn-dependent oxidoreductase
MKANPAQLCEITEFVGTGAVHPVMQTVLPFAEAPKALEMIKSGHTRGKNLPKDGD